MKRITKIIALAVLAGLSVQAAGDQIITFDIAADCRTFVGGPNRGDPFILNGKVFPAGTLRGIASNDPTQPVNGVKPIGNWIIRGRNSFPFPPSVVTAYSSTPIAFGTEYLILDDGRALTYESWQLPSLVVLSSLIGGAGAFSGAAGDAQADRYSGINASGCPNGRVTFTLQPGSVRGASNN